VGGRNGPKKEVVETKEHSKKKRTRQGKKHKPKKRGWIDDNPKKVMSIIHNARRRGIREIEKETRNKKPGWLAV
jgi:hypothetical protein